MPEISGFLDKTSGSPTYAAAVTAKFFNLLSEGVIPGVDNELEVAIVTGLQVSIDSGALLSRGYWYIQDDDADGASPLIKTHDAESAGSNRIDLVVAEIDTTKTSDPVISKIHKGVGTAGTPSAPMPTDTAMVWEEPLYEVHITGGTITGIVDVRAIKGARRKIQAGEIGATELDTGAVTASKIGSGAVTGSKIGAGAVTEAKIGASAVTGSKIGAGAVTKVKLGNDVPTIIPGTSSTAPAGTYAEGTLYAQY